MWKPHWQTTPHSQVILSPWDLEFKRRGPCGFSSGFSATPPFPALPLKLGRVATLLAPELLTNPEALFNPEVLLGMWSMVPFASGFAGGTSWGAEASLAFEASGLFAGFASATEWLWWPGWPDALLVLPMVGESGPGFVSTGGTWAGSSGGPTGAPMGGLGMTGGRGSRGGLATATSAGVHSKLLSQISSGPLRLNPCRQSTPQVQVITFPSLKLAPVLSLHASLTRNGGWAATNAIRHMCPNGKTSHGASWNLYTNYTQVGNSSLEPKFKETRDSAITSATTCNGFGRKTFAETRASEGNCNPTANAWGWDIESPWGKARPHLHDVVKNRACREKNEKLECYSRF